MTTHRSSGWFKNIFKKVRDHTPTPALNTNETRFTLKANASSMMPKVVGFNFVRNKHTKESSRVNIGINIGNDEARSPENEDEEKRITESDNEDNDAQMREVIVEFPLDRDRGIKYDYNNCVSKLIIKPDKYESKDELQRKKRIQSEKNKKKRKTKLEQEARTKSEDDAIDSVDNQPEESGDQDDTRSSVEENSDDDDEEQEEEYEDSHDDMDEDEQEMEDDGQDKKSDGNEDDMDPDDIDEDDMDEDDMDPDDLDPDDIDEDDMDEDEEEEDDGNDDENEEHKTMAAKSKERERRGNSSSSKVKELLSRKRQNEERDKMRGMYKSALLPKTRKMNSTPTESISITDGLRVNLKNFEYFDVFETFSRIIVSVKNKNAKLNCKCYYGWLKDEECWIFSNGVYKFAVGTKDHFDIIWGPNSHCKIHHQKTNMFNYTSEKDKLYLGPGDDVIWSSQNIKYEFYTLVPFKDHQTLHNVRKGFSTKWNIDSILMRV